MKKLVLFFCIIASSSCSKNTPSSNHTSVAITQIFDITDSLLLNPSATPIYSLCNFSSDIDREVTFKSVLVTDKVLNPCSILQLEDGNNNDNKNVSGVAHYRKKQIKWFYENVQKIITDFPKEYASQRSMEYSECYATIAHQIEQIMAIPRSRRVILIYSDLMDNNELYNFYSPQTQRLISTNPDKVAQMLLKKRGMPDDLRGLRIYFLFRPKTKVQDRLYQSILKVYMHLLEIRGARIIVQADVNGIN